MCAYISGVSDSFGVKEATISSKAIAVPPKMGYLERALAWVASLFSCFWPIERKVVDLTQDTLDADCSKIVANIMKDCAIRNELDFFSNIKSRFYYHEFVRKVKELHPSADPDAWIAKAGRNHQPKGLID